MDFDWLPEDKLTSKLKETYDVLFVHPPAIYDFRKRPVFPGPIAYTVSESTDQFIIPPIGVLSMADYLDRNGYRVLVDNLGERMVRDATFDAENHISETSAEVYAIDLHWCVHSQGAIEVARLCKNLHPESVVLLGGLTSTRFHEEIIQEYAFVDAVIRGEAEKPLLHFMDNLEMHDAIVPSPNLTFRSHEGQVKEEPLTKPAADINEFEFTRVDLLEPNGSILSKDMPPHWCLPICRGCVYNCATCGGSAYSYKTHVGRDGPSFRSPKKIVEDIQKLSDQGVRGVFLFQDPRMGGKQYLDGLVSALKKEKIDLERLSMELFAPADEEYARSLSRIAVPTTLTISPESGDGSCRMTHGRHYSNEALLNTIEICMKHSLNLMVFFMLGLAEDTVETVRSSWKFWEKICSMNQTGQNNLNSGSVNYSFGPMILLDPGSLAFDFPEKCGYRLVCKNLHDYVNTLSLPSWHQWISYQTKYLDRESIARLVLESIEQSIGLRQKYGIYNRLEAARKRIHSVDANRLVINEVERIMKTGDSNERSLGLEGLKTTLAKYEKLSVAVSA